MKLLKIDRKAPVPPPPGIPSPPFASASAEFGEPGAEQIWLEPVSHLLARLETNIEGLTNAEFKSRLGSYGENNASDVKTTPLWRPFLVRFENPLIIILLIAAGVSALTGGVAGFVVIVVIVMLSVVFDFVQDVRKMPWPPCARLFPCRRPSDATARPYRFRSANWFPAISSSWSPAISFPRIRVCSSVATFMSTRPCSQASLIPPRNGSATPPPAKKTRRRLQRRIFRHLRHQRNDDHSDLPD